MAYESFYWRKLVKRDLSYLSKKTRLKYEEVEKNIDEHFSHVEIKIMTIAYALRKLADDYRFPDRTLDLSLKIHFYHRNHNRSARAYVDIEKDYILKTSEIISIRLRDLCNQIIHSHILQVVGNRTRAFDSFFVVSDYHKDERLYLVNLGDFIRVANTAVGKYVTKWYTNFDENSGKWIHERK